MFQLKLNFSAVFPLYASCYLQPKLKGAHILAGQTDCLQQASHPCKLVQAVIVGFQWWNTSWVCVVVLDTLLLTYISRNENTKHCHCALQPCVWACAFVWVWLQINNHKLWLAAVQDCLKRTCIKKKNLIWKREKVCVSVCTAHRMSCETGKGTCAPTLTEHHTQATFAFFRQNT